MNSFFRPDWALPPGVRALSTTRLGGYSQPPWHSFNLALHVGDAPEAVKANRALLRQQAGLPGEPHWLEQVHGGTVADAGGGQCQADAAFTREPGQVCVVMTADCLPILLCSHHRPGVAAVHAGWRGLLAGVIENTLARFDKNELVSAWLGPAIGPAAFEVGEEVRTAFVQHSKDAEKAFVPAEEAGKWRADLYLLARQRLAACGVFQVQGGNRCTWTEAETFFSYRRDGRTGRMASMIWLEE